MHKVHAPLCSPRWPRLSSAHLISAACVQSPTLPGTVRVGPRRSRPRNLADAVERQGEGGVVSMESFVLLEPRMARFLS